MEMPRFPGWLAPAMFALMIVGALVLVAGVIAGGWWLVAHVRFS